MPDTTPSPSKPAGSVEVAPSHGFSRRRLVRAGLAAAPVLASLKSQTVLAAGGNHTCILASTFSSVAAANYTISAGRAIDSSYTCYSPTYWSTSTTGLVPSNFKNTKFVSTETGFTYVIPGLMPPFTSLSIQNVLTSTGTSDVVRLARYIAATYLTARVYGNAVFSTTKCVAIWNTVAGGGSLSAYTGGPPWTTAQYLAYFDKIYGPPFVINH